MERVGAWQAGSVDDDVDEEEHAASVYFLTGTFKVSRKTFLNEVMKTMMEVDNRQLEDKYYCWRIRWTW
jgi:hypothetical protein